MPTTSAVDRFEAQLDSQLAPSARATIDLAGAEAARLRHGWVGSEHLALALLKSGTRTNAMLRALGASPERLRERIEAMCPAGRERSQNLPYTSRAWVVLKLARNAATQENGKPIEAEFILLGLLLEEKSAVAQLLRNEQRITPELVLDAIRNPNASTFRLVLSDESEHPIATQIINQIAEAVATGRLNPGDRLATVRSLADELGIAPGTVARAYRTLEEMGTIRTDGVRGTMIADRTHDVMSTSERLSMLTSELRTIAVRGFHAGSNADELHEALNRAISGIRFPETLP